MLDNYTTKEKLGLVGALLLGSLIGRYAIPENLENLMQKLKGSPWIQAPAEPGNNNQPVNDKDNKSNNEDTKKQYEQLKYIPKECLDRIVRGYPA